MRKTILAVLVVGSFLFVGAGSVLAGLIPFTADDWVNESPAPPIPVLDTGSYLYGHDIRPYGYTDDPTDSLTLALLIITIADSNGPRTDKFAIDIGLTEVLDYNHHLEDLPGQQETFTLDDVGYTSLTASILANPDGFFNVTINGGGNNFPVNFVSSLFHAEWTRDDGIIEEEIIGNDLLPTPEPATMLLLGTGLVGVAGAARRKKKNQA